MAESELEITFAWENGVAFEMTAKEDGGDVKTIVKAEEDGNIATLWTYLKQACTKYIDEKLDTIGTVMKE